MLARGLLLSVCVLGAGVAFSQSDPQPTAPAPPAVTAPAATLVSSAEPRSFRLGASNAANPMSVSTPVAPASPAIAPIVVAPPKVRRPPTKLWWSLTIAQHGAAAFDAWSTRRSLATGRSYERNPLIRPFAHSAAIYPYMQLMPLATDVVSRRMMRSEHRWMRRTWWLPQALSTVGYLWAGTRNLHVATQASSGAAARAMLK